MEEKGGLTEMELPLDCMSHRIKTGCHSLELAVIPWSWLFSLELAPKRRKENLAVMPSDSIGVIREST